MVPADAEMVIEGHVLPNVKEVEGPFGEFTGYYGPQRLRNVIEVSAITHRSDAIFQHIFTGHRDTWVLGGIPKEGSLFNLIRGVVPTVKAVHFPMSGACRFNCYISIDKKVDGETKQAALAALGGCDFVKHVIVVDADIDIYNEEEVMWADGHARASGSRRGHHQERQRKHARPFADRQHHDRQDDHRRHQTGSASLRSARRGAESGDGENAARRFHSARGA